METVSTPSPATAKPRRRWWLRGLLLVLLLVIGVPGGLYWYSAHTTRVAWEDAEADADRTDPEWRMSQILLARRVVPDQDNAALQIIAIAAKVKKNVQVSAAPNYDEIFAKLPPNAQLNAQQVQLIQGELGKIAEPLKEARELRKFTYGRFPLKIDPIFVATRLPDHQKPRDLSDWLKHDAFLLAHEKKYDEAIDSCRACLCTARVMGDEPLIISHLIRMALQGQTIAALERVLAQGTAEEATLRKMQKLLELEIKESSWAPSLRGERAGSQTLFDSMRSGALPMQMLRGMTSNGIGGKTTTFSDRVVETFPALIMKYYPEHLLHMTRIVEISKLPLHEQRSKIQEWDEATKASRNPIIGKLAPAVSKVYQAECRSQANLRAAAAALACERYRLAHGNWPESLDVLVEKKLLRAVPTDPIDGQPLRYRKDKGMIVIYSIGTDEKDDGGQIDRDAMNVPGVDIGFRLWHEANRRQPPRPPVVLEANGQR